MIVRIFSIGIVASVFILVLMGAGFLVRIGVNDPHSNLHLVEAYMHSDDPLSVSASAEVPPTPTPAPTGVVVAQEACEVKGTLYSFLQQHQISVSFESRVKLAHSYGMFDYRGTPDQNHALLEALVCLEHK